MSSRLSADDIRALDPYTLLAALGKKVIRPGGCGSSETIFRCAGFHPGQHVLDVGCGVGTTAIQIATRFGCQVTALDIDQRMIEYAHGNIRKAGAGDKVFLKRGDMQALPFADEVFDAVTIEAVSMFVRDQPASIREAVRTCRPGGLVFDHEFVWSKPPPADVRTEFSNLVCTGMSFGTADDWGELFRAAGQQDIQVIPVPFDVLTPGGMLRDEGLAGSITFVGRTLSRRAYIARMLWLLRMLSRAIPYLGCVVVMSRKKSR